MGALRNKLLQLCSASFQSNWDIILSSKRKFNSYKTPTIVFCYMIFYTLNQFPHGLSFFLATEMFRWFHLRSDSIVFLWILGTFYMITEVNGIFYMVAKMLDILWYLEKRCFGERIPMNIRSTATLDRQSVPVLARKILPFQVVSQSPIHLFFI